MLTPYSQSSFVEKVLTDCQGRQFKALFFVALVDGEIRGRLISIQPLPKQVLALPGAVSDGTICLPAWTANEEIATPYFSFTAPCISPYFDTDILLTAQPTRAPSAY